MTAAEYNSLKEGDRVFFCPSYLVFAMPAVVRVSHDGTRSLWVNFFGYGQCEFAPQESVARFAKDVTLETTRC